jgi:hypothetical protein
MDKPRALDGRGRGERGIFALPPGKDLRGIGAHPRRALDRRTPRWVGDRYPGIPYGILPDSAWLQNLSDHCEM